jgi:hypothetical protein
MATYIMRAVERGSTNQRVRTMKKREVWMRQFENRVLALAPQHAGKIEWDSATYFYNTGVHPYEAAKRYVAVRS